MASDYKAMGLLHGETITLPKYIFIKKDSVRDPNIPLKIQHVPDEESPFLSKNIGFQTIELERPCSDADVVAIFLSVSVDKQREMDYKQRAIDYKQGKMDDKQEEMDDKQALTLKWFRKQRAMDQQFTFFELTYDAETTKITLIRAGSLQLEKSKDHPQVDIPKKVFADNKIDKQIIDAIEKQILAPSSAQRVHGHNRTRSF